MQTAYLYNNGSYPKKNRVICISGKAQHGKDTTAAMMKRMIEDDGYSVLIVHYGDLVKYICEKFFNWDGKKDEAGRQLLQFVGTDVVRKVDPDFWVNFVVSVLKMFPMWDYVLIPDCRFPNEIDDVASEGFPELCVRVNRIDFKSPLTPEQQMHPSETALDNASFDYVLVNDGTLEDLEEKVQDVWQSIRGRCSE